MTRKIYAVVTTTVNDEKGTSTNINLKKVRGASAIAAYVKAFRHLPKIDLRHKLGKKHICNVGNYFSF